MQRFRERYQKEVVPQLMAKFGYQNPLAVPKVEKVLINSGFGRETVSLAPEEQRKMQQILLEDLASISGQKPVLTQAKKSIASFKLRKGLTVGAKVTLRGRKMEDFIDRFIQIVLPRSRDFRGLDPQSFDRSGNLTVGLKEQITFPEVSPESVRKIFGLEVTVVTTAKSSAEGLELLKQLGFPFKA